MLRKQYSDSPAKTINQILEAQPPSIRLIQRELGDPVIKAILVKLLEGFINFLNIGKNMNGQQVADTISIILDTHPHLTLLDFKLFFSRMKTGFYGTFFDRMDGMVIMEKITAYVSEKQDAIEERNINQHKQRKIEESMTTSYHPDVIKAMEEAIGRKKVDAAFNASIPRERTAAEVIHDRWMKQFDNLHKRYGIPNMANRFLRINNVVMDFEKFMERKFYNATS